MRTKAAQELLERIQRKHLAGLAGDEALEIQRGLLVLAIMAAQRINLDRVAAACVHPTDRRDITKAIEFIDGIHAEVEKAFQPNNN